MLEIADIAVILPGPRQRFAEASAELHLSVKEGRMYERFFGLAEFPLDPAESLADLVERAVAALPPAPPPDLVVHCHTLLSSGPARGDNPAPVERMAAGGTEGFSATMCHCASGVAVLEMLDRLLSRGQSALVIVADKAFHPAVRLIRNTTIMGEAAVAFRVTHGAVCGRFAFVGGRSERLGRYSIITGRLDEETDPGFAEDYVPFTARCIEAALQRAGLRVGDLRLILPHNVNLPSWDQIGQRLGARRDQLFTANVPRYGHTFGADPFLNLVDATAAGLLAPGDAVALVSVGLGATAACAVLRAGPASAPASVPSARSCPV
jgi:3-oxoacyl-[acyl-carrier-protein] synthase III